MLYKKIPVKINMDEFNEKVEKVQLPSSVIWIKRLLFFRLFVLLLILAITGSVLFLNPDKGFFTGFANSIIAGTGIENPFDNPAGTFGYLLGTLIIPLVLIIGEYFAFRKKIKQLFWLLFIVDILISGFSIPLILNSIIIIVLGLMKSTRDYFWS